MNSHHFILIVVLSYHVGLHRPIVLIVIAFIVVVEVDYNDGDSDDECDDEDIMTEPTHLASDSLCYLILKQVRSTGHCLLV